MRSLLTLGLILIATTAFSQRITSITKDTTVKLEPKTFYDTVDVKPKFRGNIGEYLVKNLRIPQGTPLVKQINTQFWIDTLGGISHVEIVDNKKAREPKTPLEKEVVRVIKAMPAWEPGIFNKRKVTVRYSLPIIF